MVAAYREGNLARGYLFDTNIVIAALEEEEAIAQQLEELPAESIFVFRFRGRARRAPLRGAQVVRPEPKRT